MSRWIWHDTAGVCNTDFEFFHCVLDLQQCPGAAVRTRAQSLWEDGQSLSSEQLSISCQAKLIKSFQFTEGVKEERNKECSWPHTSARHSAGFPEAHNLSFTLFLVFYLSFLPLTKQLLFE